MMKSLKHILYKVSLISTAGDMDVPVKMVRFDSRKVEPGDVFVAVRGTQVDGHDYIDMAVEKGAVAIVGENEIDPEYEVTSVQVKDSAAALALIASNFYDNPSEKIKLIAVTGTNGKTTTVFILFQLFRKLGYHAGLLSTIYNMINDDELQASHTTADALQLNRLLKVMVDQGCTHCFMEASSHAIHQKRVFGLQFDVVVFSNITHEHLDYHKTFDAYIAAKKKIFDDLGQEAHALINVDDKRGRVMVQNTRAKVKTYALKTMADYRARVISDTMQGLELEIGQQKIWFKLIGSFNAYNLLSAYATAIVLGEDENETLTVLSSLDPVPGRFQRIYEAAEIIAIVDYAHTPDALENVLKAIQHFRTTAERVITVVGCGGNRDREKRPKMGDIASRLSDRVILTSDNPRDEDPATIIEEMKRGVNPANLKKTVAIVDRAEAIKAAIAFSKKKDIILVAGKGHEEYQEIKGKRTAFSDRNMLIEMFKDLYGGVT
jgi:UDP-N-acetylmuramoyl-L-alanyl-D-glutamate--2,6-diaminopimelate ligase